ncbi:hypothetical protein LX64_02755 [Chitinophaga skermanii]|uniref:Uncharacterized protein n=1 Tax=Chitinophaga skermanii TaxID=331697 RepID=A0A327QIS8_9BACT|nr:hypothetical protein LX64_02755 [Chitinophaga skermanii]
MPLCAAFNRFLPDYAGLCRFMPVYATMRIITFAGNLRQNTNKNSKIALLEPATGLRDVGKMSTKGLLNPY